MERGYWIRSKPVYGSLVWRQQATAHIVMVEESAGAIAAIKLLQQLMPAQPVTLMLFLSNITEVNYSETLRKIAPDGLLIYETREALMQALREYLPKALMGLRIYVAGSEKFMWSIAEIVSEYGVEDINIDKELTGTLARSVYCVHCKAITHDVHANIAKCDGCGKMLFVRDHFSRRMGAYMGLMVDAESPGELPEIDEIYP